MTFNDIAKHYLDAFEKGEMPQEGMANFERLQKLSLDGSLDSVSRLDAFLLQLKEQGYADEIDLEDVPSQNLLYMVAFYLGRVAGDQSGVEPNWVTWKAVMEANPGLQDDIPEVFGSSVLCLVGNALYIPLSVVMARLFEGTDGESLRTSLDNIVGRLRNKTWTARSDAAPQEGSGP